MLKKDRVAHYLEKAERLEYIIPNFDPANGDMILVFKTEDVSGGRSFRLSPELAPSSVPIFSRRSAKRQTDYRSVGETIMARCPHGGGLSLFGGIILWSHKFR
ncbi:MAG: hypothetical protein E5Y32_32830 [Mesorhizobium sp.]|nr:MAG: hypothetical protein E5Y32_32830 [Mesorhizobium sp.]